MQRILNRTAVLLLFLPFISSNGYAFTDLRKNSDIQILVLFSFNDQLPWIEAFKQGLNKARIKYGGNIQFYIENMEEVRLSKSLTDDEWAAYLAKKYQAVKFDAAIAVSDKASGFLSRYEAPLFGDIPYVYHSATPIEDSSGSKTFKPQFRLAIARTLQLALQQNKHAEQIVIVGGQNRMTDNIITILLSLMKTHSELNVTILQGYSVAELQEKLSALPANSIVFYNLIFKGKKGQKLVPEEVLAAIAERSKAPIYAFSSSMLGNGTVGGHVIDAQASALQTTNALMDYLQQGAFKKVTLHYKPSSTGRY